LSIDNLEGKGKMTYPNGQILGFSCGLLSVVSGNPRQLLGLKVSFKGVVSGNPRQLLGLKVSFESVQSYR